MDHCVLKKKKCVQCGQRLPLHHFFLVSICCQVAVSDLLTDLGSNVIINCDLDENEVYWILLKTPDPPTVILRSFTAPISQFYFNKTFRNKYSVQFKHCLVINNVTADELGVYYCMNTRTPPKLSNSTRLHLNGEFFYSFRHMLCLNQSSSAALYSRWFTIKVCVISVCLQVLVEGFICGSFVLPCSSDEHDLKLQDINVLCRDKDSETIYDIINGKDSVQRQDPQYKNRAETFPEEYERGNFSIKLINLNHTDAGQFSCFIIHTDELCTIQLIIKGMSQFDLFSMYKLSFRFVSILGSILSLSLSLSLSLFLHSVNIVLIQMLLIFLKN
uniref:Immunoglobulin domain-containing protein n=1 Tax=Cyprinus carpio TaxID=7962 RepID=A0A8C1UWT6_CYPCA